MNVLHLAGCSPTPLAHYLKAWGILRLIAQQKDPQIRGYWREESFWVVTRLTREELESFFAQEYAPTPLLAPWNGGSGFYPKDNREGVKAILQSSALRMAPYREALLAIQELVQGRAEAPKNDEKAALIRQLRTQMQAPFTEWLDAAVAIKEDGSPAYPALLGTGGNDGRLDFTNNFMQRLSSVLDLSDAEAKVREPAHALLLSALWGEPSRGLSDDVVGQFLPSAAGGANSAEGYSGKPHINPWDFILMLEGAVCFRSSIVRRGSAQGEAQAAAPFATRSMASGYGSAAQSDESARGEQWMPLWNKPATWAELQVLLREGRSRIGGGGAVTATDFARAATRMGTSRGIQAFQRFGYQERNGQANFAVPIGRWQVSFSSYGELIDEVAPWVERLRRIASDKQASASYERASRSCTNALLECTKSESPLAWQHLLRSLVRAESLAVLTPRFAAAVGLRPLPRLSSKWWRALSGGRADAELRLAAALGNLRLKKGKSELLPLKRYWLPIEPSFPQRFATRESSLDVSPEQVARGVDFERDSLAILLRRSQDPSRTDATLGIEAEAKIYAKLGDLAQFFWGTLDQQRLLELALGLMNVRWRSEEVDAIRAEKVEGGGEIPSHYCLLRLAVPLWDFADSPNPPEIPSVRVDPAILRKLAAGQASAALDDAARRLRASRIAPKARLFAGDRQLSLRAASSLLFPLSNSSLTYVHDRIVKVLEKDESGEAVAQGKEFVEEVAVS